MRVRVVSSVFTLPLLWHLAAASLTDTISPTQPLNDGQTLTSGDANNFVLGFFSPGNSTQLRYVGIWYNKVPTQTVVWVANRDRPVNGSNGVLSVANDGTLVLSSHNSTLWSTAIDTGQRATQGPPKARLLDSGNLVVLVQDGPRAETAWQSFDHPTHVLLPGAKLGVNRKTGLTTLLSSWRSNDDPGQGSYTFRADDQSAGTPEFFLYNDGTVPVWRSGPYVGQRWSGLPEMTLGYIFNHIVYESPEEVYFRYDLRNDSIVAHFVLDGESATFKGETWHQSTLQWIQFVEVPQETCDTYAYCGAFGLCNSYTDQFKCSCFESYVPKSARDWWYLRDGSGGCVRAANVSMCRNGEGFLKLANVKVPDTSTAKRNMSMSLEECREECLQNCSCLAYTSGTDGGDAGGPTHGCFRFHAPLVDTRLFSPGGQDLYFRVDAIELAKSLAISKGRLDKKRLVILVVCCVLAFAFLTFLGNWFYRKNKREGIEQEERSLWLGAAGESTSDSNSPVFRFSTIVDATQNFQSLLGQGGFGPVYKGMLSNGQEIAVKRLSKNSGQGIEEFKTEVRLISKLQHRNLVKTLGCCVMGEEKMLVYEFLPNKSLDKFIFDEEKKLVLNYNKRYEIIIGIARGVLYLHQDSRLKIIHRDLKASNILLDDEMNPKISDFGLAKIFGNHQREANTNRVVGTYGYMSPEYAMEGVFSIKSDVYSFGVILLEIISGQRSSRYHNDQISTNLSGYVWTLWKDQNVMDLIDKSIVPTICGCEDDILRCIQIGLLCVQENPNERPTMLEVTFMLCNNANVPSPKEPAFFYKGSYRSKGDPHSTSTEIQSVNDLTETIVYAR